MYNLCQLYNTNSNINKCMQLMPYKIVINDVVYDGAENWMNKR